VVERVSEVRAQLWARTAGVAYLLIIALGVIVEGFVTSILVVDGEPAVTAANIEAHLTLFRGGSFAVLVLYALVLLLALALYEVLRTVDRGVALVGLLFRSAEGIVGLTTVLTSLVVLQLLDGPGGSAIDPEERYPLAALFLDVRTAGLDIVLFLIGIGGTAFCYLLYRSRYVPRWLAAWGIGTYLSMLGLATMSLLLPDHPSWLEAILYGAGTLFEVLAGLWLTIKGIDIERWKASAVS
jgi:hypothetical protein